MTIILGVPTPTGGYYSADTTALREIEQEVARRVGPFQLRVVTNMQPGDPAGPTSTTTTVAIRDLRSSIDLGGLEDMYVLRRGRLADGTRLPATLPPDDTPVPYDARDRVRLVRSYDPTNGVLEVDNAYYYAPNHNEEVELHHLDPGQELRPMVLAGLRRCWLTDILPVPNAGIPYGGVIDLTQLAPWLTTRDQVYDVMMSGGSPMANWKIVGYGGGLNMRIGEWSPQATYVLNRRPAATKVLPGTTTPPPVPPDPPVDPWVVRSGTVNEPWDDEDRFAVPLDYAAAAGHIEGWRSARPRLTLVAQTGMWAGQPEAAAEFTRVATVYFDPPRHQNGLAMWPQWAWDSNLSNS